MNGIKPAKKYESLDEARAKMKDRKLVDAAYEVDSMRDDVCMLYSALEDGGYLPRKRRLARAFGEVMDALESLSCYFDMAQPK